MAGFIYIMSNPAFPSLLKIGKSKKDPTSHRVNELNTTGVPQNYKVEYYAFVEDEDYLENAVHTKLDNLRPNKNREHFEVDCLHAIEVIKDLSTTKSKIKYEEVFYVSPAELARREAKRLWELEKIKQAENELLEQQERQRLEENERKIEQQKIQAREKSKQEHKEELQKFITDEKRKAETRKVIFSTFIFIIIIIILGSLSS